MRDRYYIQITWAGGNGCDGDHNNDDQATTGMMCVQIDSDGARSRKCDPASSKQLFRTMPLFSTSHGDSVSRTIL